MIVGDKARINQHGYDNHIRETNTPDPDFLEAFHGGITGEVKKVYLTTEEEPITKYQIAFNTYRGEVTLFLFDNEVMVVGYREEGS